MTNWTSVKDIMPTPAKEVWVYTKDGSTAIGSFWRHPRTGRVYWSDVYGDGDGLRYDSIDGVTHWRLIDEPDPPQAACVCSQAG